MKKIITLAFVLFAVLFSSCSSSPMFSLVAYEDGSVLQQLYIPFSAKELYNYGLSVEQCADISSDIKTEFDNIFTTAYNKFKLRINADTTLTLEEKFFIEASCPSAAEVKGTGNLEGIAYNLVFDNVVSYYYYNMDKNFNDLKDYLDEDDSITDKNFLTTKKVNKSATIYGSEYVTLNSDTLGEYILYYGDELLSNYGLTKEQINEILPKNFVYSYGTTMRRLHSDADEITKSNGIYYHFWEIDADDTQREISTWTTSANQNMWYVSILGMGIVFGIGIFVVSIIKRPKQSSDKE